MPAASNPSNSIFPKNDNYPLVVKPHPIRVDAFQHPIPFSSAFASYIAVNLYLAMRMFVDALVQADNYIIGYSGYSICHLCGEKFNIYLLFIYHTVVHCCEILEFEKHNFVIWNLFVADYISVVNYAIPMPFEIMLSMEQMRSRQNLTSSDKLRNDPIRSQRGKENECITERDERFTSGTSESEHQKHHINISYLLQCMLAGCSQTQTAPECFKNASSPTTIQEHNLSFANINQLKRATTTLATNAACFFVHFDGCSIIDSVSMISVSEYYCKYDSFLPDDCCITLMIEDGSNFDGNFEAVLHSSTVMESNYTANATSNYVNTGSIDGTNKRSDSGGVSQTDHQQSGFLPYCGERSIHLTQASEQLPPEQSTVNSNSTETKQNSRKRRGRIPKAQLSKQQKSNQQIASSDQSKEAVTVQNCEEKDAVVKNAHENLPNANSSQLAFHSNNTSPQTNYSNNQLNNSGITCPALTEPDASNKKRLSDALANAYQLNMEYNYTANATSNYANDGSNSGGLPRSDNLLPRFHPYSDDRSRRSKLLKAACPQKQMENQQSALSDQPNSHFPYKVCSICTFRAFYNAFPPPNFNEYLQRALSCNQNCVLPVVTDPKVSISSNNLPVITSSANNSQSMPLASRACENTYSNNQKKSTETQWGMGLTTKDKAFSDTLQVEMPPPPSGLANYMSSQNNTIQAVNSSTIDLQSAQSRPSGANTLACNNNFMMPKLNNNFQPHGTSANPLNWERVFSGFPFFKCYVCNASFGDYYAFKMHAQLHSKPIQTDMISNFLGTSAMLQNSAFSPPGASSVALPRSNYPPYYKQSNIIGGHEQMPLGKPNYPMLNSELYSAFTNFQQGGGAGNLRYGNPSPVMAQANFPNYGQNGIVNQKGIYGQQPSVASDILNPQNANASSFPGLG
ncbi:zinc finger protein [Trichinella spiralis]|uniref:zinc finger protein n=1 Tax=Trichinella spiralis TaxID=6334 RepID=UPI0001EFD330|nr:zinc finger protein [Trichinella spiralis]